MAQDVQSDLNRKKINTKQLLKDRLTDIENLINPYIDKAIQNLEDLRESIKERYKLVCEENINTVEYHKSMLLDEANKSLLLENILDKALS